MVESILRFSRKNKEKYCSWYNNCWRNWTIFN